MDREIARRLDTLERLPTHLPGNVHDPRRHNQYRYDRVNYAADGRTPASRLDALKLRQWRAHSLWSVWRRTQPQDSITPYERGDRIHHAFERAINREIDRIVTAERIDAYHDTEATKLWEAEA